VAGTIAATKGNGVGVVGVAPGVDLFIARVFDDSCHWAYASSLIDALNRCTSGGADIVSMSLGCTGTYCRSTAEQAAYDQAYANGVLSIAAAGNDGTGNFSYPASYGSVVSVAAVDSSGTVASFSQKNDQVELAAPGVGVRSTVPGGYASWSGTSMATPHVSGVSALIWSNFPDASNVQIREALDATALDKGPPGRDTSYGFGIVQAKAAFDYLTAARAVPVPPPAPTPTRAPTKAPTRRPTKAPTRRPTKAPVQGQCASQGASCRLTPCCAGLRCKSRVCRL
jgi:subtilisin family serine protease